MKIVYQLASFLTFSFSVLFSHAQLNMTELGVLDIPTNHTTILNDIWGYTDELGNEYALVGATDGVSVVDVTDPTNPTEVFWVDGLNSIWRDLKTYGDYAYVTTEALQGLMIIDLSPLPESTDLPVTIYNGPEGNEWESAHNLYQEDGYVYIFGAGRDNKGVIILDVATDPLNPIEVGVFDDYYCHDGFVKDNKGYFAHIYDGFFSVVDLTDKSAPVLLGTAITPTNFSHNIWASEDGNYVFTTDEVSDGYIGAFDVSDPTNIIALDEIQCAPGTNIVPHNSHVKGNYLYTSYYTYGVVIHDITHPNNIVEVANYDTNPSAAPNFDGCWGVYPFLGSGNIIASDRQMGLFVLGAEEQQGSYLEGNITEEGTGFALSNVEVTIEGETTVDQSNISGDYATGIEGEGTINVTYFKVPYYSQTIATPFVNGVIYEQDVVLERIPEYEVSIKVLDAATLDPIEGANVRLKHTYVSPEGVTAASGSLNVPLYYQDNYDVIAGKWGYKTNCFVDTLITDATTEIVIYLEKGYYDDFSFDFGWEEFSTASRGDWEREIPVGVTGAGGDIQNPYADISFDCGDYAYITGNGTTATNTEEVNDGEVLLVSPEFDLTGYDNPHINFSTWFFCLHGAAPDDTLEIFLLNGEPGPYVRIDKYFNGGLSMSQWHHTSIPIEPLVSITSTMKLMVRLTDELSSENVTEAAFDNFSITDYSLAANPEIELSKKSNIKLYPNPFSDVLYIDGIEQGWLTVLDVSGRQVLEVPIQNAIDFKNMEKGTYFFVISDLNKNPIEVITQIKY